MSNAPILSSIEAGVMTLQFNRVDKKNAITAQMYQALADGLTTASNSSEVKVVKIIGADNAFCAGNDLIDFLENPPHDDDSSVWQFLFALNDCSKPIVAGVNGPAVGVGTTLLLHCDLVVAAHSAVFMMPFVSLGLCPEAASSLLLPANCGMKKATEWLLLGNRFDAREAEQFGLINRAVETAEEVTEQVEKWCQQLTRLPQESIKITRNLLRGNQTGVIKQRMIEEGDNFKQLLKGESAQQAFAAFLNRD
ncbi:MAG: enoyl-CoA hydratase [Gammaproteobacteria bacterium]|nr:enoyl-CoA hydratase [Gammaproteobacteria bacterium]